MITFDHIAIAAPSLKEGVSYLQSLTGITLPKGGEHPDMGTHNHLTALGPDTFAEVIAINPDAPKPNHPRWFNLDHVNELKTTWLLRTDDIEGCIAKAASFGIDLGRAIALQRANLRWRFTVRDDGTIPLEGAAPLILQWDSEGPHPASNMMDQGLRIDALCVETPYANELAKLLEVLGLKDIPEIKQASTTNVIPGFSNA
jgi:hypothetical protein